MVIADLSKPHWKPITYYDVTVRRWKSYYLITLPEEVIPDQTNQLRIKQVFKTP